MGFSKDVPRVKLCRSVSDAASSTVGVSVRTKAEELKGCVPTKKGWLRILNSNQ